MFRKTVAIFLAAIYLVPGSVVAATPQTVQTPQEQVLALTPGTLVEVKLKNKQRLRGRLGEATADAFDLQYAQKDRVETRIVSYAEVKSIRSLQGEGKGTRFLAALGGVFLVLMVFGLIATGGRA